MIRNLLLNILLVPIYMMCCYSLDFNIFLFIFGSQNIYCDVFFSCLSFLEFVILLGCACYITKCGKFLTIISSNIFSAFLFIIFPSGVLFSHIKRHLILYHRSLKFCSFFINLFLSVVQMGQFLLVYLQIHWFWYWTHLVTFLFQLLNFQLSFYLVLFNGFSFSI